MPTRTGIATIIGAVVCFVAGRVFGIFELYIIAAAMLALAGCATLWVVANWRSLAVQRNVSPPRLHAGDMSTVTLNLSNPRLLPTPVVQITDEVEGAVRADAHVPPISRANKTRASYRLPTESRGRIEIGPMRTKVTDPFGLAASTRTSAPDASLLVLPRIDPILPPPQPGGTVAQASDRSPNRVGANGDEFSSLRAYAIGDDLRKVHWPSSARTGELVVRNDQVPEHGHSLILLDVRRQAADAETFELMVSAAASILVACRDRGDNVRMVTTDGVDMTAESASGCDPILDMLALVQQTKHASVSLPFRLGRVGAEAGAMIVANDAEALIATMPTPSSGSGRGTYIVRFHPRGANPTATSARLPSSRMIDIEFGGDFASSWAQAVNARTSRR
jgi:uncharacterized protein (DUF58 family)